MSKKTKISSIWQDIGLIALVTIIVFVALELIARIAVKAFVAKTFREQNQLINSLGLADLNECMQADSKLFWTLKPEIKSMRVQGKIGIYPIDFNVNTNSKGMRDSELSSIKKAKRILAIGNSCTFGVGVNDETTWPSQLETLLGDKGIEVINAGVPGYTSFQGLRYLKDNGLALEPDVLIASFGFNDIREWASYSDMETAKNIEKQNLNKLLSHSRLFYALSQMIQPKLKSKAGEKKRRLNEKEFFTCIQEMISICKTNNIKIILLIWPYRYQMREPAGSLTGYQPLIKIIAEKEQIAYIHLPDTFRLAKEELFVDDIHANAIGCEKVAKALSKEIFIVTK